MVPVRYVNEIITVQLIVIIRNHLDVINADNLTIAKLKQHPSTNYNITSKFSSPIFINVQVNGKRQHAIIDTGSAVNIINQQLLKNIHHKKFMYKYKSHKSANSTSINIIGEIQLEIKIQGHTTLILADVATNIIT
ncbi:unnamed protein product, partial [Rotaria magnacalcarata]